MPRSAPGLKRNAGSHVFLPISVIMRRNTADDEVGGLSVDDRDPPLPDKARKSLSYVRDACAESVEADCK